MAFRQGRGELSFRQGREKDWISGRGEVGNSFGAGEREGIAFRQGGAFRQGRGKEE